VSRLAERHGDKMINFSPEFLDALKAYHWPGNVRELINAMERVLAEACTDATVFPKDLPPPSARLERGYPYKLIAKRSRKRQGVDAQIKAGHDLHKYISRQCTTMHMRRFTTKTP
jgi:DNA-binding NtrC family response regulator